MKLVQHSRLGTKAAAVAALAVVLATAAVPAWASSGGCGATAVPLPGAQPVKNGSVHHGVPTLSLTLVHSGVALGSTGWEVHLTETNRTGAAYTHITPIIGVFGVGLDPKDTFIEWMKGSDMVPLPVRGSCDPTVWLNSAPLDGPLADGASRTFDLYISTPTSDALNIKNFQVYGDASADGTDNLLSNSLDVTNTYYEGPAPSSTTTSAKPTTVPTQRPTTAPASTGPQPSASVTTASPQPTATPRVSATTTTVAPTGPSPTTTTAVAAGALADTGGGSNTGLLAGTALALLGAGVAVTVGLRRRNQHN